MVIEFDYHFRSEDTTEHNDDKPRLETSLMVVDNSTGAVFVPHKGRWQHMEVGAAK